MLNTRIKLLYLEDSELDRRGFLRMIRDKSLPYDLTLAETLAEARKRLAENRFDLIVADYHLPDGHGTDLFEEAPDTPFVLLTGTLEESLALRTLERGADDYLPKTPDNLHLEALPFTIEKTLHRKRIRERERQLTDQLRQAEAQIRLQAAALQAAPNAISLSKTDPQGTIAWVNAAFTTLTGYSTDEAIGHSHNILHSGRQDEAFYRRLWETIKRGEVWRGELVNRRKDGSLYHEEMGITPLRDEHGHITHYVAIKQDITQRKQAEEALRQSEERLRLLVDSAKDYAILMLDPQGQVTTWNIGAQRVIGWKAEEILGRHFSAFFPPEEVAAGKPQQELDLAAGHGSFQAQACRLRKDGTTFWADITLTAIKDPQGHLLGFAKVTRDITERAHADEARARLAALVESSNDAIVSTTLDGTVATWNAAAEHLLGYSPAEIIGRSVTLVIPPDRRKVENSFLERLCAGGHVNQYETVRLAKDGRALDVQVSLSPLRDPVGQVVGVSKIIHDISHRKRAEEALRASQERLILTTLAARLGTWDWDILTDHLVWSPRCLELFGLSPDTGMTYERFLKAVHPEDRDRIDRAVRASLERHEEYDVEMRSVWPDGSLHWVTSRGRAYYDPSGRPTRMSGVALDITARKQAEEALRHSEDRRRLAAEELQAIMDATPGGILVAHDSQCHLISGNGPAHEVLGVPSEEENISATPSAQGASPYFRIYRDGREANGSELPMQVAAATGAVVRDQELEVVRRDGTRRTMLVTAAPLYAANGQLRGAVGAVTDITERKRVEEVLEDRAEELRTTKEHLAQQNEELEASRAALERERTRYRELFDLAPDPYFVTDLNGHIREVNRAACQLLEQRSGYLLKLPLTQFIGPHNKQTIRSLLSRFRQNQAAESQSLELSLRSPSRPTIPCAITLNAVKDEAGAMVGLRWLIRDMTEEKQTQATVARLASFPERNPNPIAEVDLAGHVHYVNPVARQFYPDLEQQGFAHPWLAGLQSLAAAFQAGLASPMSREVTVAGRTYHQTLHYLTDAHCLRVYSVDITERKRAEDALERRSHHLQLLHQASARLLVGQQPVELLRHLHPQIAQVFGADAFMLYQAEQGDGHLHLLASAGVSEEEKQKLETMRYGRAVCDRPEDALQPIIATQIQTNPAPNRGFLRKLGFRSYLYYALIINNCLHGTVAFASRTRDDYDPTDLDFFHTIAGTLAEALERERLERQLQSHAADLERTVQQRTAKLQETIAELEGFSYSLIHDMRAPLRAMQAYASILQEEAASRLQPEESDLLVKIQVATNRMDHLITDSLNYSRILRANIPLGAVNLGALLRGMIETYPNFQPSQADISLETDDILVSGNEAALTQIFSHLLGNAVKFVPPGVHPRIRVWAEPASPPRPTTGGLGGGDASAHALHLPREPVPLSTSRAPYIRIWVEDNGIGIPEGAHEKIFVMFQRLHREDEYPGTGIGLAIVRKAVERMGGRVGLESEPAKGSKFWLELPIPSEAQNKEPLQDVAEHSFMSKPSTTSKKHTFHFAAPNARNVLLVGEFTQWQEHGIPMHQDKKGVWTTTVELAPGKHAYRFIVDGEWRDDPECALRVANPFGGQDMIREAA